ncbi:MAG: hypothetical protein JJ899_09340 [Alphaproteobacteria bacterium]|nr:hypothetical protein [Alphaproteobacteria bacterium]
MSRAGLGLLLIVVGVLAVNYAYLHDIVWQTQNGFIVMGIKSYMLAIGGTIVVLAGGVLRGAGR